MYRYLIGWINGIATAKSEEFKSENDTFHGQRIIFPECFNHHRQVPYAFQFTAHCPVMLNNIPLMMYRVVNKIKSIKLSFKYVPYIEYVL